MNIGFKVVQQCSVFTVVTADGRTIFAHGAILKARLEEAICDHKDKKIIVDMTQVLFIHSAVVVALIEVLRVLHGSELKNAKLSKRGNVVLCVSPLEKACLETNGFGAYFPIFDSLEEAVAFFNGEGASD